MKKVRKIRQILGIPFLLWMTWLPTAVLAHDGSARVVLNKYAIAPGQTLEVSGINLGTDLELQLMLIGGEKVLFLGNALCDGHGDFIQHITLPADLPLGVFTIQVIDTSIAGLSVVMAETRFKIDEGAVSPLVASQQIITSNSSHYRWQQLLFAVLTGVALLLFLSPTMIKWWRSNKEVLPPSQSRIQSR